MPPWQFKKFQSPLAYGDWKVLNCHTHVVSENLSITKMYFPSPHPWVFFPFLLSPFNVTKTFSIAILCDSLIKKWG